MDLLKNDFNNYSEINNLNITLEFEILKYDKPTDSYVFFKQFIESSLKKSTNKNNNKAYDIYFYDNKYLNIYGPYLLDLKDLIPKDYIEMHDPRVIKEICTYNDTALVGFVIIH